MIAASWKLNTRNNRDEMHLFIDGLEVPNVIKYGQKLQPYPNEPYRTVDAEILNDGYPIVYDIFGSDDLVTQQGSPYVSSSIVFSNHDIQLGTSLIYINEPVFSTSGYVIIGYGPNNAGQILQRSE